MQIVTSTHFESTQLVFIFDPLGKLNTKIFQADDQARLGLDSRTSSLQIRRVKVTQVSRQMCRCANAQFQDGLFPMLIPITIVAWKAQKIGKTAPTTHLTTT
uniref:(northern house mosquito) hypothetical protein n=1 Tax=Culex pipiens TaxID=7175 RepID=A0A8D8FXF9_CULPI